MKKTLITILVFTIIIGVLGLAMNIAFGGRTITYVERVRASWGGFYYWKFDFENYIKNLTTSTSDVSVLQLNLPTRTWIDIDSSILESQFWEDLGNNLAVMVDWVIAILNVIFYPLRVGSYVLTNILAILGINQNTTDPKNGLAWLVTFARDILSNISIPYI